MAEGVKLSFGTSLVGADEVELQRSRRSKIFHAKGDSVYRLVDITGTG